MIDEETLANLLVEHAERIPVPSSAISELLAAAPQHETVALHRFTHPSGRLLAAAAIVAVVAAGTVWALGSHSGGGNSPVAQPEIEANHGVVPSPPTSSAPAFRGAVPSATGTGGSTAAQGGANAATSSSNSTLIPATPTKPSTNIVTPTDSARVVRTGTLDLRVARHTFGEAIGRITTIAAQSGGFIADEQTYESAAIPSGTVTIRVPSARFNATVQQLRALGTAVSASTRGVDVTGQYTDLQARLQAATATREQYLTVLTRATNIGDILSVQDRIQDVQTQIEQLQGQISELTNQTTYGTITISVSEPTPRPKPQVKPHHESGVSLAWGNARNGFARRVEGVISHSGSALVVLIGLLLVGGAIRLLVPRMRRLLV